MFLNLKIFMLGMKEGAVIKQVLLKSGFRSFMRFGFDAITIVGILTFELKWAGPESLPIKYPDS